MPKLFIFNILLFLIAAGIGFQIFLFFSLKERIKEALIPIIDELDSKKEEILQISNSVNFNLKELYQNHLELEKKELEKLANNNNLQKITDKIDSIESNLGQFDIHLHNLRQQINNFKNEISAKNAVIERKNKQIKRLKNEV